MDSELIRVPNVLLSTAQERQILDWCHQLTERGRWQEEEAYFGQFFVDRRNPHNPR